MARGTNFGGIHSHIDLNLIQQKVEVEPAEPKLNMIEIPGADGAVDLSEHPVGRVTYKTRRITWTFALYPGENWDAKHRQVSNALNGRRCNVTLDTDPEYYYQARLAVTSHNVDGLLRQIVVEAICQPYKLRQLPTQVFVPFCGKNLLDVSLGNQTVPVYGTAEYIPGGVRKSGSYYVGFRAFVKPNTVYYLTTTVKKITEASAPANGGRIAIYDRDIRAAISSYGSFEGTRSFSFNSGNHSEVAVLLYSDSDKTQGVYEFTNLQLEPLRATTYEPFVAVPDKEVILLNDRKAVVPTITCSGETTITLGGASYTVNAGTHKILDFQLEEGETRVQLTGTGAASITYQEGAL